MRSYRGCPCALRGPGAVILTLVLQPACDGSMPHPRYAAQRTASLSEVGYPPPPARVELIPKRPPGDPVWLDGEWSWTGSKWSWTLGRWVIPPRGATFSPWTTVRDERGVVYFAGGMWNDALGQRLPAPPSLASGRAKAGDVTSPEGATEKTGVPSSDLPP